MADPLLLVLQVSHVAVAATAFAVTLTITGALRRATGQSRDVKAALAQLLMRSGKLASLFGVLTFLTGVSLIMRMGGFAVVAPGIHAGMAIVLGMIALGGFYMRPTGMRIVAAVDQDDAAWTSNLKRYNIGHGIMQSLWLITLVLMFIKRGA